MEFGLDRQGIEQKFFELCNQVVNENDLKVYDLSYMPGQAALRVFIMNPDTKTALLEDCVKVDRALSPHFDTEGWIPEQVLLEVSSPGLFRQLKELWHFEISIGERIQVYANKTVDELLLAQIGSEEADNGHKPKLANKLRKAKKFTAILKELDENRLVLDLEGIELRLPFLNIKKANVEPEF